MTVPPVPPAPPAPEFLSTPSAPPQSPPAEPAQDAPTPDATGIGRRVSIFPRTLTSRIVAGVVALTLVVVAAVGAGTYIALHSFLYDRLSQQVDTSVNAAAASPCFAHRCDLSSAVSTGQVVWIAVLDPTGAQIPLTLTGPGLVSLTLPAALRAKIIADPGRQFTMTTSQGDHLRLAGIPNAQTTDSVVIGLSTRDVENTLHQLVAKELLIGLGAVLVALFATTYGVSFSLRRLRRVTATAQEVAAELSPEGAGLDRRVELGQDHTEVGQLAESMNTLLAAVETQFAARVESENRMRQFLADASHELRTPLTSIRGYAELARMQRAAGNADEDNLGRIEAEGTRMSRLVEDLLLLARGDQDSIPRIELVDVADIVDDAVSGARAANPHRSITVAAMPSYSVVGDPDQLVRVIRNLLTNAVVHTPETSPIRVASFVDGPGIAIQVIDGGPGLPPEEAAHVFERFWRADKARTRARGGSGLGLSIVASIVHAHQGATHFESTVAGGSTVTVWLPGVTT